LRYLLLLQQSLNILFLRIQLIRRSRTRARGLKTKSSSSLPLEIRARPLIRPPANELRPPGLQQTRLPPPRRPGSSRRLGRNTAKPRSARGFPRRPRKPFSPFPFSFSVFHPRLVILTSCLVAVLPWCYNQLVPSGPRALHHLQAASPNLRTSSRAPQRPILSRNPGPPAHRPWPRPPPRPR
jgi:hypothetical protein